MSPALLEATTPVGWTHLTSCSRSAFYVSSRVALTMGPFVFLSLHSEVRRVLFVRLFLILHVVPSLRLSAPLLVILRRPPVKCTTTSCFKACSIGTVAIARIHEAEIPQTPYTVLAPSVSPHDPRSLPVLYPYIW